MNERARKKRIQYKENRKIGMTRANAAIAAGFPTSIATRRATAVAVVDFQALFEQKGLTNIKKVEKCMAGLNAEKVVSVEVEGEHNKRGGKVYKEHTIPDWQERRKHLELALKLCKQLEGSSSKGGDMNVLVIGSLAERIKKSRERNVEALKVKSAHMEDGDIVVDADVVNEGEEDAHSTGEETQSPGKKEGADRKKV